MLSEMSADEWLEWQEYAVLEPFGEKRADYRNAIAIVSLLNNGFGIHPTVSVDKFMPEFGKTDDERMRQAAQNFDMVADFLNRKQKPKLQ